MEYIIFIPDDKKRIWANCQILFDRRRRVLYAPTSARGSPARTKDPHKVHAHLFSTQAFVKSNFLAGDPSLRTCPRAFLAQDRWVLGVVSTNLSLMNLNAKSIGYVSMSVSKTNHSPLSFVDSCCSLVLTAFGVNPNVSC